MRNGYGRVTAIPTFLNPSSALSTKIALMKELHALLDVMTIAEEAAVRPITPLISMIQLKHGNLASKGKICCVNQECKFQALLPNLPRQCKTIVVYRKNHRGAKLKSYQFERRKIERFLYLVLELRVPGWYGRIHGCDQTRLEQWPLTGNLVDLADDLPNYEAANADTEPAPEVTHPVAASGTQFAVDDPNSNQIPPLEAEEEDEEAFSGVVDAMNARPLEAAEGGVPSDNSEEADEELVNDDGDHGPAPMQNRPEDHEEISGVVSTSATRRSIVEHAINSTAALANADFDLRDRANAPYQGTIPYSVRYDREQNPIVHVAQHAVMPIDGFVNMETTPYAWAMAFPTIFRPNLDLLGNVFWLVTFRPGTPTKSVMSI